MNEFNTLERRAGLLTLQGMQQATIQTGMFMQALAAHQAGNDKLVNFYVERFLPAALGDASLGNEATAEVHGQS